MTNIEEQLAQDILVKEETILRISARVIYGCALALVVAVVWIAKQEFAHAQLRKEYDEHIKSGSEYRERNDKRWLRINNALIRLQQHQGIRVPPSEIDDDLDN